MIPPGSTSSAGINGVRQFGFAALRLYRMTRDVAEHILDADLENRATTAGLDDLNTAIEAATDALARFGPVLALSHGVSAPPCRHGAATGTSWHEVIIHLAQCLHASPTADTVGALLPLDDELRVLLVREIMSAIRSVGENVGSPEFFKPVAPLRARLTAGETAAAAARLTGQATSQATLTKVLAEAGITPASPVAETPLTGGDLRTMLRVCNEASPRSHAVKRLGCGVASVLGIDDAEPVLAKLEPETEAA